MWRPYIRGDEMVAMAEDKVGTIMIKRYRMIVRGESDVDHESGS